MSKAAIITGASGGLGSAVARRLATDGFAIAVNYSGNSGPAEKLVAELKGAGGQAIAVQADVTKPADVENLFKKTLAVFGGIDVVVHSAGIMAGGPDIKESSRFGCPTRRFLRVGIFSLRPSALL